MELEWIFICEYALIDKSNKLAMIGEFTSMWLPSFPIRLPPFFIVARWIGEKGSYSEQIKIVDENQNVLVEIPPRDFEHKSRRSTSLVRIGSLNVEAPGKVFFQAYLDGEYKGDDYIYVRKAD